MAQHGNSKKGRSRGRPGCAMIVLLMAAGFGYFGFLGLTHGDLYDGLAFLLFVMPLFGLLAVSIALGWQEKATLPRSRR